LLSDGILIYQDSDYPKKKLHEEIELIDFDFGSTAMNIKEYIPSPDSKMSKW
jgi:hypothetical protein